MVRRVGKTAIHSSFGVEARPEAEIAFGLLTLLLTFTRVFNCIGPDFASFTAALTAIESARRMVSIA